MSKRNINADLFRVLATVLVVMLHVLGQGGILKKSDPDGAVYWIAWFLEIIAYGAVNCFALISGYVMCEKNIKAKSIIALYFQVWFYSILISLLYFVRFPATFTRENLLLALFPIVRKQWWYVSAYFVLFFFIPILNAAIRHLEKETFKKLLFAVLVGFGIITCLVLPIDAFGLKKGYSAIWLIILYLFGGYVKKYNLREKITAKKSLIGFFASSLFTLLFKALCRFAGQSFDPSALLFESTFVSYISITVVAASVFLFLFCLNVRVGKFTQRAVTFLAPASLGVYLIHVHPLVFNDILKNAFSDLASAPFYLTVPGVLAATLAIFLLCSLLDLLRIRLFSLLKVGQLSAILANVCRAIYKKVFRA